MVVETLVLVPSHPSCPEVRQPLLVQPIPYRTTVDTPSQCHRPFQCSFVLNTDSTYCGGGGRDHSCALLRPS
jgi:hypothetical protein